MERCRHVPAQTCRIITKQRGRQHLADRLLAIEMAAIPDDRRREDADVAAAFAAAHPPLLGGLLDLACDVLGRLPSIRRTLSPRPA